MKSMYFAFEKIIINRLCNGINYYKIWVNSNTCVLPEGRIEGMKRIIILTWVQEEMYSLIST